MRLWKGNKIDAEWVMSNDDIAAGFLKSKWAQNFELGWPLDRALRAYITDGEPTGLDSVFEDGDLDYDVVYELVLGKESSRG